MKSFHRSRIVRPVIACMLTVCLAAGMLVFAEPAYGGSQFTGSSPFSNTGYSTYYHNGNYSGNLIVNGVDVSYFNSKASNWKKAKANGVDYAIMRVTFTYYAPKTLTTDIDSKFTTHYANAKAAGVMKGVYVFSQAKNASEARKEAQYAIKQLKKYGITYKDLELPLYMDYEYAGNRKTGRLYGITKSKATAAARAFCDEVRKAGFTPGIYACTSFYRENIDASKLESDIDIWCAQYYNENTSDMKYSKWQYSSTGKIGGILSISDDKSVGYVDCDFWYISKKKAKSPITEIYGRTDYNYTGKAIKPKFYIYNGSTRLREGKDYIVGGIRNVAKSSTKAYAYIKGIGDYKGYALIPIRISTGYAAHKGLANCKTNDGKIIIRNAYKTKKITSYLVRFLDENGDELSHAYYKSGTAASSVKVPEAPEKADDKNYTYEFAGWTSLDGAGIAKVTKAAVYLPVYTRTTKTTVQRAATRMADAESEEVTEQEEPAAEVVNAEPEESASEEPVEEETADAEEAVSEEPTEEESADEEQAVEEETVDAEELVSEEPTEEESADEEQAVEEETADAEELVSEEPSEEESADEEQAVEEETVGAEEAVVEEPSEIEAEAEEQIAEEETADAEEAVVEEPAEEQAADEETADAEDAVIEEPAAEEQITEEETVDAEEAVIEEPAAEEQVAEEETAIAEEEEPASEDTVVEEPEETVEESVSSATAPAMRAVISPTSLPESKTEKISTKTPVYGLSIGSSFVRKIPSGLTVGKLLKGLKFRDGYKKGYSMAVISTKGKKMSDTAKVKTGMMLAVYKGTRLIGTADLTVAGDTLNDRGANYLKKK